MHLVWFCHTFLPQKHLRSMWLNSIQITGNKKQGILGYQIKNEAKNVSKIGLNLIYARTWKREIRKCEELIKGVGFCLPLANNTRGRTTNKCWLCVHCVHCASTVFIVRPLCSLCVDGVHCAKGGNSIYQLSDFINCRN
jgi:hypothetical protein